jgi:hypothetical protein
VAIGGDEGGEQDGEKREGEDEEVHASANACRVPPGGVAREGAAAERFAPPHANPRRRAAPPNRAARPTPRRRPRETHDAPPARARARFSLCQPDGQNPLAPKPSA